MSQEEKSRLIFNLICECMDKLSKIEQGLAENNGLKIDTANIYYNFGQICALCDISKEEVNALCS